MQQGQWEGRQATLQDDDIRRFLLDIENLGGIVDENPHGRPPRRRVNFSLRRLMEADPDFYGKQGSYRRRLFQKQFTIIRAFTQEQYEGYLERYRNPVGNVQEG